jgi:hypothetical protein
LSFLTLSRAKSLKESKIRAREMEAQSLGAMELRERELQFGSE